MRGIVHYTNYDDMKYAIRKLDDSLFRNQYSRAYIRVCNDEPFIFYLGVIRQSFSTIFLSWSVKL
ncbi:unnamed protein product [Coffea canephora]|uniref:RRM domain-containing protein n=1 Tax=Coffea canephora TaxID=49390 RepID=A0A068UJ78_COFCA|nr:unnamed protein product [Coffea canephora]